MHQVQQSASGAAVAERNHGSASATADVPLELDVAFISAQVLAVREEKLELTKRCADLKEQRLHHINELLSIESAMSRLLKRRSQIHAELNDMDSETASAQTRLHHVDVKAARIKVQTEQLCACLRALDVHEGDEASAQDSAVANHGGLHETGVHAYGQSRKTYESCVQTLWHAGGVLSMVVEPATNMMYTGGSDGLLRAFDLDTMEERMGWSVAWHPGWILDVSAGEVNVATADSRGHVRVWELEYPQDLCASEKALFHTGAERAHAVHLDSFSSKLVSGDSSGMVIEWDVHKERCVQRLLGHMGAVNCVARCEYVLVSCSSDRKILFWDARTGRGERGFFGHKDRVNQFVFDDECLMSVSDDLSLKLWDIGSGRVIQTIPLACRPNCISLRADVVSVAGADAKVYTYVRKDLKQNLVQLHYELYGHTSEVTAIAQTAEYVISASTDSRVKLWSGQLGSHLHSD
ncbi:putative WD repeat-containing protein [Porphyridium purpureum]|uniref:Putative WD repeat-containing protein n=1 Tax=Porphyridium purpureum TaxID=35688 RepID=A0A5J4YLY4_PORPP|nr:putative WD repeat-containing protein [Porphyridium purpureum]|eukprot:POR2754..scf295_9